MFEIIILLMLVFVFPRTLLFCPREQGLRIFSLNRLNWDAKGRKSISTFRVPPVMAKVVWGKQWIRWQWNFLWKRAWGHLYQQFVTMPEWRIWTNHGRNYIQIVLLKAKWRIMFKQYTVPKWSHVWSGVIETPLVLTNKMILSMWDG